MMSHYKVNPVTRWLSHRNKSRFHAIVQIVGSAMILLGAAGKFSDKDVHFNTWHGRVGEWILKLSVYAHNSTYFGSAGALATLGCVAGILGGFVNYFQPKFALKIHPVSELRFRHNLGGIVTFTFGMGAIYLGYYSKFFTKFVDNDFIPAMMLVTTIVYVLSVIAPVASLLPKLRYRAKKKELAKSS